jgi:hypothetical protein
LAGYSSEPEGVSSTWETLATASPTSLTTHTCSHEHRKEIVGIHSVHTATMVVICSTRINVFNVKTFVECVSLISVSKDGHSFVYFFELFVSFYSKFFAL